MFYVMNTILILSFLTSVYGYKIYPYYEYSPSHCSVICLTNCSGVKYLCAGYGDNDAKIYFNTASNIGSLARFYFTSHPNGFSSLQLRILLNGVQVFTQLLTTCPIAEKYITFNINKAFSNFTFNVDTGYSIIGNKDCNRNTSETYINICEICSNPPACGTFKNSCNQTLNCPACPTYLTTILPTVQTYSTGVPTNQTYSISTPTTQTYSTGVPTSQTYSISAPTTQTYSTNLQTANTYSTSLQTAKTYSTSVLTTQTYSTSVQATQTYSTDATRTQTPYSAKEPFHFWWITVIVFIVIFVVFIIGIINRKKFKKKQAKKNEKIQNNINIIKNKINYELNKQRYTEINNEVSMIMTNNDLDKDIIILKKTSSNLVILMTMNYM